MADGEQRKDANLKVGSLLRMFQSEHFDAHLHMDYLYRKEQPGIQSYLVNQLYKLSDQDIDFYLPQLCHLSLLRFESSELSRFLLDKAGKSMYFALKIHWLVQAAVEDQVPQLEKSALQMWQESEMAMVNSKGGADSVKPTPIIKRKVSAERIIKVSRSDPDLGVKARLSRRDDSPSGQMTPPISARDSNSGLCGTPSAHARVSLSNLKGHARTPEDRALDLEVDLTAPNALIDLGPAVKDSFPAHDSDGVDEALKPYLIKKQLCDYFNLENFFISYLLKLGNWLVTLKRPDRQAKLQSTLMLLNQWLFERRFFMVSTGASFSLSGVHVPLLFGQNTKMQLLRVHVDDCKVFSSKKRAPFLFVTETADLDEEPPIEETELDAAGCIQSAPGSPSCRMHWSRASTSPTHFQLDVERRESALLPDVERRESAFLPDGELDKSRDSTPEADKTEEDSSPEYPKSNQTAKLNVDGAKKKKPHRGLTLRLFGGLGLRQRCAQRTGCDGVMREVRLRMQHAEIPTGGNFTQCLQELSPDQWYDIILNEPTPSQPVRPKKPLCAECAIKQKEEKRDEPHWLDVPDPRDNEDVCFKCLRDQEAVRARHILWPERFEEKISRLRKDSPYGFLSSWKICAYILKAGDDVRQELLASQLIRQFQLIFRGANLNLWLRPIEVLTTSSDSGLIEFVENSCSIDAMKKKFLDEKGNPLDLAQIFKLAFGDNLFEAKKNFIESFAAYSLVSYFLQVKDRHNGNLLLDSKGHFIHIDFGFMLSNAPGGALSIETSPFKLTQEFLDVMGGESSEQYEYFRTLMISGFLAARKHAERIVLLVRMMIKTSKLPCMAGGHDAVLKGLEDRFFLKLPEEACTEKVVDLIDQSANNWTTRRYDDYQRIMVGIH